MVIHSRGRILPELSESLADYALDHMRARGVTFKLGARVNGASPGVVVLDSGERIRTETLAWTAGTTPNPLLMDLPIEHDKRGATAVDEYLAVPDHDGLWAVGDCAAVTDARTGEGCPPTAQFALREAYTLARKTSTPACTESASSLFISTRSGHCASWATTRRAPRSRASASPCCWPGCCGARSTWPSCLE